MWRWNEFRRLKWVLFSVNRWCIWEPPLPDWLSDILRSTTKVDSILHSDIWILSCKTPFLCKIQLLLELILIQVSLSLQLYNKLDASSMKCNSKSPNDLLAVVALQDDVPDSVITPKTVYSNMHSFSKCSLLYPNHNCATWKQVRRRVPNWN